MAKHLLSLEVPGTNNPKVFRIVDTSQYAEGLGVDCQVLQITSPGFIEPVAIEVLNGFNLILNSCTLGITPDNGCSEFQPLLPDGIYNIRYSISPNDKAFVQYYHLRTTRLMNQYYEELAKLEISACEPVADIKAAFAELNVIKSFIDAAKGNVEYAHELRKGTELLTYARKTLIAYSKKNC